MTDIGTKIKYLRQRKNWNQTELAQKIYVTPQAISKWKRGLSKPTSDSQVFLSEIFEVSLDKLCKNEYTIEELLADNKEIERKVSQKILSDKKKLTTNGKFFMGISYIQTNPILFAGIILLLAFILYVAPLLFFLFIFIGLAFVDFKKTLLFFFSLILLFGLFFLFAA